MDLPQEIGKLQVELEDIHADINEIKVSLGKKVNWTVFLSTLVSLVTIQLTVSMFIYNELKEVRTSQNLTQQAVSRIEGKLEPFDFVIEE